MGKQAIAKLQVAALASVLITRQQEGVEEQLHPLQQMTTLHQIIQAQLVVQMSNAQGTIKAASQADQTVRVTKHPPASQQIRSAASPARTLLVRNLPRQPPARSVSAIVASIGRPSISVRRSGAETVEPTS